MNGYTKIIIIHLLCLIPILSRAELKRNQEKLSVQVQIVVEDSAMMKNAEIRFEMSKDGTNSRYISSTDLYSYKLKTATTTLTIPLSTPINYGRIVYNSEKQKQHHFTYNKLFLFEYGDDLTIVVTKKGLLFSGKNSDKYNYLEAISQEGIGMVKSTGKIDAFYKQRNYEAMIHEQRAQIDSMFVSFTEKLKRYKAKISPQVYGMIEVDNWARYNSKILGLLVSKAIGHPDPNYNKAFRKIFSQFFANFNVGKFDDQALAHSYLYADFLYQKERRITNYAINDTLLNTKNQYTFKDLYTSIQKLGEGLIRDKLTLIAFTNDAIRKSDSKDFVSSAIETMGDNKYRKAMETIELALLGNAFPFQLPDASGKIHKLSDFEGKLIIIDFWFTGCVPCKLLSKAMKPIVSAFKNNPNVVFITISVDGVKKRDVWLKSLQEETYTSNEEINLLALDGRDSEIVKFYNIQGYPAIFLISKGGKIITTRPPRPSIDVPGSIDAFKALINQYL